jgi:excisionase family DNA binding protein
MSDKERPGQEEVRLLDVRQAAKFLGTTEKTLYSRVWKREIVFVKIGRSVRFDLRDLEQMIEDGKVKPQDFPIEPNLVRKEQ